MKVDFCINDSWGRWNDVTGEIVDVAPHLSGTFAVHRCVFKPRLWKVSDVETGSSCSGYGYTTRAMAIHKARIALRDETEDTLQKAWGAMPDWVRSGRASGSFFFA